MSNTEQATTPTPPAKDWREFVEERTKGGADVLTAVQVDGTWHGLTIKHGLVDTCSAGLRLKPQPKTTRPWTPDEVPVGATVKCKQTGEKHVLLCNAIKRQSVWVANHGLASLQDLHDNYLLELTRPSGSAPGSYGVCGVEE